MSNVRKCPVCGQDMRYAGRFPHLGWGDYERQPGDWVWGWRCEDWKCEFRGCLIEPHQDFIYIALEGFG